MNDPSENRSECLLLGAHGLQELIRASHMAKAAQAASFPVDLSKLRDLSSSPTSCPPFANYAYSFAHLLHRSSRRCCSDTYWRNLRRKALENRIFQQTRNLLFPKQRSLRRIKSEALPARPIRHMPVLFAVGDCCAKQSEDIPPTSQTRCFGGSSFCSKQWGCL